MAEKQLQIASLPEGWIKLPVEDACKKISLNGIKVKQKDYQPSGKYPVVDQGQDLIGGYFDDDSLVVPDKPPYVIFGDHTKVKKFIAFKFIAGADGVKVLKPRSFYDPKLFFFFIHYIKIPDKGYARHFQFLEKASIPLPPLPEQHRIVEKIEALFSELDKGIEQLKTAQQQLKVYRQAVLKWAFEGKLTEEWREGQKPNIKYQKGKALRMAAEPAGEYIVGESAGELLERIKLEREAQAKASGKKLKPIAPLTEKELAELSDLPKGWSWAKVSEVTNCLDSLRVPINKEERKRRVGAIPYYGANGRVGWIDDFLFNEPLVLVVEDETFTGREIPFSYKVLGKSWVNNHAHVLQATSALNTDFLNFQLAFYPFLRLTTGTTGRKKLTQAALMKAPFRLCPAEEQVQIVQEIETRLSVCDKLEETITSSLQQAEALRQSILKKAFEGKLVPQDPNDPPASELLGRIKAEKDAKEIQMSKQRKKRTSAGRRAGGEVAGENQGGEVSNFD